MRVVTVGLPLLALLAAAGCQHRPPAHSEPFVDSLPPAAPPEPEPAEPPAEQAPAAVQQPATSAPSATNEVSATATVNGAAVATAPAADAPASDEQEQYAETDASATTEFRETLAPHGQWAEDPSYGTVWVPARETVGADFTPYGTSGHWAYDSGGNYVWASDYPWGWATFHYGRWVYVDSGGWAWIPGRRYASSWVVWRTGDSYVGWAPMGPSYYWRGGRVQYVTGVPVARYSYVETRYLFHPNVSVNFVPAARVSVVAASTQPYVGASARAGVMAGPPPSTLRIPATAVVHAQANDAGVMRAQAIARPSFARTATTTAPNGATPARPAGGSTMARTPPSSAPQPQPVPPRRSISPTPAQRPSPPAPQPRYTPQPQPRPSPAPQPRYTPPPAPRPSPPAPRAAPPPQRAPAPANNGQRRR